METRDRERPRASVSLGIKDDKEEQKHEVCTLYCNCRRHSHPADTVGTAVWAARRGAKDACKPEVDPAYHVLRSSELRATKQAREAAVRGAGADGC